MPPLMHKTAQLYAIHDSKIYKVYNSVVNESVYQYIIKIIIPEQSYLTPDFLGSNDMVAIFRNYNVLTSKNIRHTVHLTKSE